MIRRSLWWEEPTVDVPTMDVIYTGFAVQPGFVPVDALSSLTKPSKPKRKGKRKREKR